MGEAHVLSGEQLSAYSLDAETPVAAVFPADEREAAEVARVANARRVAVVVWGGGTKQDVEPVQPRDGIVLATSRLNSTIELDAANLTVTVGAGRVLDDLQRELAEARLFLPLDPIDSVRSTVGGSLAANSSGPSRLLYRTARDLVLGLHVVTPTGKTIRVGGKTVKDVAGYDLKKLYIGSWGTLGAITQATFRLLPLPEARATVVMVFRELSNTCATVLALLASFLRPSTADLLSYGAMPSPTEEALRLQPGEYLLLVAVEGAFEAVERQKRELLEMATRHGARDAAVLEGTEEAQLWQQRRQLFTGLSAGRSVVLLKGSVPLKRVFDFCSGLLSVQRDQKLQVSMASHAGNGIVYGLLASEMAQTGVLESAAERLQQLAADCGGFAVVQRAPREVVRRLKLWPPRNDYGVMRRIKRQLDPYNLWSPARTPGGPLAEEELQPAVALSTTQTPEGRG